MGQQLFFMYFCIEGQLTHTVTFISGVRQSDWTRLYLMLGSPQGQVPSVTIQHYSNTIESVPCPVPFLPVTSSCQNWKEPAVSERVVWEVFFDVDVVTGGSDSYVYICLWKDACMCMEKIRLTFTSLHYCLLIHPNSIRFCECAVTVIAVGEMSEP